MGGLAAQPIETRVGILTGWRCWFALPDEGLLRPIYKRGLIWKPRQPFEAACPDEIHAVPADGCKCGIWAVCHPMLLEEVHWTQTPPQGVERLPGTVIIGQVALWGSVIEHERGWRAQFAYPTQLYVLTENGLLAQRLRERYLVPVASGPEAALLEQILPPHLRNRRRARAEAGATKRAAFSEVPAIPCATPTVVELIHGQELRRLERAREALQRERERLKQERQLFETEHQILEAQRQRREVERQRRPDAAEFMALKKRLKEHGILQRQVAQAADVGQAMVGNLLAGRTKSRRVRATIGRLLAEAEGRHQLEGLGKEGA